MIPKRTITVSIIIVFSLLFICLSAFLCLFFVVPQYVESEVIPSILKDKGLEIFSLKVRSIGLNGLEISDVKIGPDNSESLAIDSIRLDYSISGLLDRQIQQAVLSGVSVSTKYENNNFSIGGLNNVLTSQDNGKGNKNGSGQTITIKSLLVTNSVVNLKVNGNDFKIPIDISATDFDKSFMPGQFSLRAYPGGNSVTVEGKRGDNGKFSLAVISNKISLAFFEDIFIKKNPVDIKGKTDINLVADLSFVPFSITNISSSFRFTGTIIDYAGVILKNPLTPDSNELPVEIKISSRDSIHWGYEISQILLVNDTIQLKSNISGTADLLDETLKGETKVITRLMTGDDAALLKWDISTSRNSSSGSVTVQINGKTDEQNKPFPFKASFNRINITTLSPEIGAQLEYNKGILSGSYLFNSKNIGVSLGEKSFSASSVSVKGSIGQSEKNMDEYVSPFSIDSKKIIFNGYDIKASIPDYLIRGTIGYDKKKGLNADAKLTFKKGVMSMREGSLNAKGISGEIPVKWPFYKTMDEGSLHVEGVKFQKHSLGPIDLKIPRKGGEISFAGTAKYPVLPDMTIKLYGSTSLDSSFTKADIYVEVPAYQLSSDLDLGRLLPELKGYRFNGLIKNRGEIKLADSLITSGLNFGIEGGRIANSEKNISLENISLDLKLEDLVSIKSPFGQRLKIAKLSFGDIQANDFILYFKIDSPSFLFVEKGNFKWSGGRINIQSFGVNPEKEEYDLILFCDRLKLSEILAQFGVANASGGGAVNGKLPIKISRNKISFEDGFLYSTPGGGGKINITGTDILTAGLDPNSAAYAQMDIAREALKAFDYTWVKMTFESEKDELVLQLQFDGKPENRLPFRYSKDAGRFLRVESSMDGSDFEGISLDVNFRVPFDKVLNIKDVLNMID